MTTTEGNHTLPAVARATVKNAMAALRYVVENAVTQRFHLVFHTQFELFQADFFELFLG
ncbi:MAG TPA: hypothetical protein VMA71_00920 [Alloacidobacterium sp.]|nr:hypothetical protein [Alloacidobacterium sp.]